MNFDRPILAASIYPFTVFLKPNLCHIISIAVKSMCCLILRGACKFFNIKDLG